MVIKQVSVVSSRGFAHPLDSLRDVRLSAQVMVELEPADDADDVIAEAQYMVDSAVDLHVNTLREVMRRERSAPEYPEPEEYYTRWANARRKAVDGKRGNENIRARG